MHTNSLKNTLFVGLLYNLALNAFLYIGQIGIVRSLSRVEYAQFIVATNFVVLFSLIVDLGLTSLTVKLISEAKFEQTKSNSNPLGRTFGTILLLRIILSVIVVALVQVSANVLGYSSSTIVLMSIFLPSLFISSRFFALRAAGEAFLRGTGKYRKYMLYATIDAFCFSVSIFIAGIYKSDVITMMLIYTLTNLPGFLLLTKTIYTDLKSERVHLQFDATIIKNLLLNGSPLIVGSICLAVHNAADPLILDKLSTPSEVSAFGASLRVQAALMFLPIIFSTIVAPEVTRLLSSEDALTAQKLVHKSVRTLLVLTCGVALIVTIMPNLIVSLLFGQNKYSDISSLIQLFAWTFVCISYSLFIIEIAVVEGKQWITMLYMVISMSVSLTLDILLIPSLGAYGATMARFISILLATIIVFFLTKKMSTIDTKRHQQIIFRFLVCITVSLLIYFFCVRYEFDELVCGVITMLTFSCSVYFTRLFNASDLRNLNLFRSISKT